ncbi:kinase-like domain-containing protein [Gigaspora rosea]|uniref:Kinase-like domain-containing protein n=1 Tax=Gigaspora rosea TaxID=44941 RepID=A0A397VSP7_9GLOM|nr:kinase-like domain-containing protein [Gigaspora rosea]
MKGFQLRTWGYERMNEWIPFDRLNNIKKIGQGGFSSVYSATWLDGIRKLDDNNVRIRESFSTVALKTLSDSKKDSHDFLKEFESHAKCNKWGSKLQIYGLTQNTKTNEYLMVFQYANNGSLYKFLRTNFQDLTWQTKLKLLKDISDDLCQVHKAGYIHSDFHSGNILQNKCMNNIIQSYISDLGLSKGKDNNDSGSCIYGVMPYVAPEVLSGQKFTPAADIYGFGVIMSEISTGQRPFDGCQFNDELAVKICFGLRPEFASGTPDFYIELAKQCMDSDPQKRPTAWNAYSKLQIWNQIMSGVYNYNPYNDDVDYYNPNDYDADEIKKQFLNADKIVKELQTISPKHPEFMYTSKIINTQQISIIQATLRSKPIDSVEVPLVYLYSIFTMFTEFTDILSYKAANSNVEEFE